MVLKEEFSTPYTMKKTSKTPLHRSCSKSYDDCFETEELHSHSNISNFISTGHFKPFFSAWFRIDFWQFFYMFSLPVISLQGRLPFWQEGSCRGRNVLGDVAQEHRKGPRHPYVFCLQHFRDFASCNFLILESSIPQKILTESASH